MKIKSYTELFIFIVTAELVGVLSALVTGNFSGFFDKFTPPPLLPPAVVFPVVWVILYAFMGISAYLVYSSDGSDEAKKRALRIYAAQLAVNFSWSIVFFRFEELWGAAGVIILLLVLVILMILSFKKVSPLAAALNIPYLLWVLFASYLNIATAVINK